MQDLNLTLKPLSYGVQNRINEIVKDQRCMIQNISPGVQRVHVYDRNYTRDERIMRCLEWNWGMTKGSLNLDTSRNIMFLGSALYERYKKGKWALLPEEWVVRAYFKKSGILPFERVDFPIIASKTFKYKLIPIQDMEDFWVTCQNDYPPTRDGFVTHMHPFDTLPTITSHIHPTFAILHLGSLLTIPMKQEVVDYLGEHYPLVDDIGDLYSCWTVFPPDSAEQNPTYVTPCANRRDEDTLSDYPSSEDDSICTPPRHIKAVRSAQRTYCNRAVQTGSSSTQVDATHDTSSDSSADNLSSFSQQQSSRASRKRTLSNLEDLDSSHRGKRRAVDVEPSSTPCGQSVWTSDEISRWAEGCSYLLFDN